MKAEILAVGTEILLGDISNTNAQYLAQELAQLGIEVYHQSVVGDNAARMREAIEEAFCRSDLLVTTGGLGPTEDDLTKEIATEFFGDTLVLNEHALARMETYFRRIGRDMTENNRKQALVPQTALVLQNNNGTAPGLILEKDGKMMVLLPGPPREMMPMFTEQVRPELAKKQEKTFVSRILRVANVGESGMETMVHDLIDAQTNPTIAPYARDAEALLRITAEAKTAEEAEKLIAPVAEEIYRRLGDAVYAEGETDMATVVAERLLEKNKTISLAESCTGGLLTAALVSYPGISKVLLQGVVSYSNEAKENRLGVREETLRVHGAVSAETAAEMAEGVARTSGTQIGLSVTGVAGPDGGTPDKPVGLVYLGLFIDGKTETKELHLVGKRNLIRERTVFQALNWLRLSLG